MKKIILIVLTSLVLFAEVDIPSNKCAKADKFSREMNLTLELNSTISKIEVPKMLVMKKGSFIMGCEGNKSNCQENELPPHKVTIRNAN